MSEVDMQEEGVHVMSGRQREVYLMYAWLIELLEESLKQCIHTITISVPWRKTQGPSALHLCQLFSSLS